MEAVQRARAAHVQVHKAVVQLTGEAIRVCGERAILKRYPLERLYQDARASAVIRPWTQDLSTLQAWEAALAVERRDSILAEESHICGCAGFMRFEEHRAVCSTEIIPS